MDNQPLLLIYRLYLDKGGKRSNWIESNLGYDPRKSLSVDDRRNEPETYEAAFSKEYQPIVERLYLQLMDEMKGLRSEQCTDALEALVSLQWIGSLALWKYHQNVGEKFEAFVREFDRLDVPGERLRLYEVAQTQ
jgi:hypothetical protein